jgi:hypothetical protein
MFKKFCRHKNVPYYNFHRKYLELNSRDAKKLYEKERSEGIHRKVKEHAFKRLDRLPLIMKPKKAKIGATVCDIVEEEKEEDEEN